MAAAPIAEDELEQVVHSIIGRYPQVPALLAGLAVEFDRSPGQMNVLMTSNPRWLKSNGAACAVRSMYLFSGRICAGYWLLSTPRSAAC